jgi:sugar fermentation stimulation protein A
MTMPAAGVYIAFFCLRQPRRIRIGRLGTITFQAGVYAYAGSAQKNLLARLRRHARRRKPRRWHIDYLSVRARMTGAVVIVGPKAWECKLARRLKASAEHMIPGFGCTDCGCPSHLYRL